ncbi:cordon-bleu protein-like 1 isoform X2 [Orcinus orca]|uniref:cordon-bleu protein-like 1 isoform X2 n=1 Tax=Orcinus orca TaxID=9733 RepID=UPI002111F72A|nr:cordon-bleu protein-like 1 isoform X2 [Orcinus orca]
MPPSPVATSGWRSGGDSCELPGSGEGNGAGSDAPPRSRSPRSAPQGDGRPSPARAGRPGGAPAGDPRRRDTLRNCFEELISTLYLKCVRRKPKAKAPLPPAETKYLDASSVDDSVESSAFIMEQKENTIDKDIELLVVLPGDIIKSTTVHGSKPMMDLLIFLCAQYHLNPSSHTIDLLSAEKNPIKFKPNTPIGMLEVEKVILKPKILDKKKPTPIIPEKTVRVVINFKKTQKTIVRVSPHAPLEELAPVICSKCEFDPLHTLLLKDYQSQESLDLTKSLNELGLRELYAMDVSRATSVTAFNKSSFQETCQISQNLDLMKDKENKGFFSLFQRSKKKREQTASAPATPLVSKHRSAFTRSNTMTKQYISNTLPSDAPKKRRAPLPPMPGSQRAPQDLAHIQERPASCVVKSTSLDETEERSSGAGRVRTGSLQLGSTSGGNSSLKRTKRKAPSPPSKTALQQSDENSHVTALQLVPAIPTDSVLEANSSEGLSSPESSLGSGLPAHEQCAVPQLPAEAPLSECPGTPEVAAASLPSGISSDYSLEEVDEKQELSEVPKDEAENTSLKSQDIPTVSTDIINTLKSDPDSALGSDTGESSQNSKEEKQGTGNTDGQGPHIMVCNSSNKARVVDSVRNLRSPGPNQENDQNEIIVIPTNTEDSMKNGMRRTEINVAGVAKSNNVDVEVDRLSNDQAYKTDTARSYKENHLAASSAPDQKLIQPSAEKTKMQDAAIQTIPSCDSFDGNHQDHNLSDVKVDESVQTSSNNKSTQHSSLSPQDSLDTSREFGSQGPLITYTEEQLTIKDPICAHGNDDLLPPVDGTDKNSTASYIKTYPFYRQDYNPKPKPSNEITREYIPKIGMTTYKIVPPRSLEILKDWESETIGYKNDQEINTLGEKDTRENVKVTAIQTEDPVISESPKEPEGDLKPKPTLRTEHQVQSEESLTHSTMSNPLKPTPKMTRDTGTAPFVPNLEDINSILESKLKSRVSNPHSKPSSFFLQMQKRVSGHYVTSAAAKSIQAAPNPTPKELIKKEVERDTIPPPEPAPSPLSKTTHSPPQPHIQNTDDDSNQKPAETSPPPVAPKPVPLPKSQLATLNLKTLKTFGAPRPYSSSAPSPFALAVVKRSQSFSKGRTGSHSEEVRGASARAPTDTEGGKIPSVNTFVDIPQPGVKDKENNSAHNEQNPQTPSLTDGPSFTLKRQSSSTFQSSDPEQIRQSLLTAIRSGEAAAKLKRVAVPSNTVSVNGRSRFSRSMSLDAQDGH